MLRSNFPPVGKKRKFPFVHLPKSTQIITFLREAFFDHAACLASDLVLWTLMDSNNSKLTENEPPSIYQYFESILQLGMTSRIYHKQSVLMQTRQTSHLNQQDPKSIQALLPLLPGWETATTRWHPMLPSSHTVHPTQFYMAVVFLTRQIR